MPNYLELPPELQSLIEKREAQRRLAQRRDEPPENPKVESFAELSDGQEERRQNEERRTLERRQEDSD